MIFCRALQEAVGTLHFLLWLEMHSYLFLGRLGFGFMTAVRLCFAIVTSSHFVPNQA
jgi:hypothetical protein